MAITVPAGFADITPGVDFEFGTDHHPDEHVLELTTDHLSELAAALHEMNGVPVQHCGNGIVEWPERCDTSWGNNRDCGPAGCP